MPTRPIALAVASLAAAGVAAAPASAAPLELGGKATTLAVSSSTAKVLKKHGIKVSAVSNAKLTGGAFAFPITSGVLDTKTGAGQVLHSGGLRFRHGSRSISLTSLGINTKSSHPYLSARVHGKRVRVADLTTSKATVSADGITLTIANVGAALNRTGAAALNKSLHVTFFKKGTKLGTAAIAGTPKQVVAIKGGSTSLAPDPNTTQALLAAGIVPGAAPGSTFDGSRFNFPITAGAVASNLAIGSIGHTGGITLTKGSTVVALTDFKIQLDATPSLYGTVNGLGGATELATLDLTNASVTPGAGSLTVSNVKVALTAGAAAALNAVFGTNIAAGTPLGVATVTATL